MCGIAGFIDLSATLKDEELKAETEKMTSAIIYRGPDDAGFWCDEKYGVAFGQRRLSIIDLSPEGHQPMFSSDGRFVIVFNGEIYNFPEMRKELEEQGVNFRGHSDTEIFLEYTVKKGFNKALEKSNGMFAIALWDNKEKNLYFARDRLGQKPLYYGWSENKLFFSSELKAIKSNRFFNPKVNKKVTPLYVRHGYVPAPYSVFEDVFKLPAGSYIKFNLGENREKSKPNDFSESPESENRIKPIRYWSASEKAIEGANNPFEGSDKQAIDELENLLKDAVSKCMISDVPLGAFLSGGIDSSTIVALMQSVSNRAVKTFSIGFDEKNYNEAVFAKEVANHIGTDHTELYLTQKDALDLVPSLSKMYDEPFADSSQMPTHLVSKLAKEKVTVSLSGDGGDELFGGYNRYLWAEKTFSMIEKLGFLAKPTGKFITSVPVSVWDNVANLAGSVSPRIKKLKQVGDKAHKMAGLFDCKTRQELYLKLVSFWNNPLDVTLVDSEPETVINNPKNWFDLGQKLTNKEKYIAEMMLLDAITYMSDDILVKVDRAAMSVSLESRVPLLDHRVFEFAWKLKPEHRIRDNKGKWLLREVLYRYVPKELIERPKMGFGVPIDSWLRNELRDWAEDLLSEKSLNETGVFNAKEIQKAWAEHLSGKRNWQHKLWAILMYSAWHKEYING